MPRWYLGGTKRVPKLLQKPIGAEIALVQQFWKRFKAVLKGLCEALGEVLEGFGWGFGGSGGILGAFGAL